MNPISPDEALYAFVDGELELGDEQRLFDSLASHPELRTEMKDVLAIRNAVHRDVLFPPATAETEMLAATGLAVPVGVAAVATAPTLISRLLHAGGGILAGVVIAYFLFSGDGTTQNMDVTTGATPPTVVLPNATAPVRVETLYVRVPVRVTVKTPPAPAPSQPLVNAPAPLPVITDDGSEHASTLLVSSAPQMPPSAPTSAHLGLRFRAPRFTEASPLAPSSELLPVSLRLRSLASSLSGEQRIPASVSDAILPNTAFALMYPLDPTQRVGVEFGLEAFQQVFTSVRNGRPVEVDQTPVLYWLGGAYEWSPIELDFLLDGLRPFIGGTMGYAFSQGPVARGTIGLQYQPAGPIRFTAGLEAAGLAYADSGNWFISKKWGFSYGLSIDLGAIK